MFTDVDERGQATERLTSVIRRQRASDDQDADYEPGGGSRAKQRQVRATLLLALFSLIARLVHVDFEVEGYR